MVSPEHADGLLLADKKVKWVPSVSLRPHHVFDSRTQDAIAERKNFVPVLLRTSLHVPPIILAVLATDPSGYMDDVWGKNIGNIFSHQRTINEFFDQLCNLSGQDVIHLDLQPDGICKSCVVGKHCSGTNYKSLFCRPSNTMENEKDCLSEICSALRSNGFKEGKDFIFRPTTHILFDFLGKDLKDQNDPRQITIKFNSMLVKVSALRKIIKQI